MGKDGCGGCHTPFREEDLEPQSGAGSRPASMRGRLALAALLLLAGWQRRRRRPTRAVARGAYLADAAGLRRCHTDASRAAALCRRAGAATPFGTFYTPNITPDPRDRHRRLERGPFRAGAALGDRARRRALFAGLSVSLFNRLTDATSRTQGLSVSLPAGVAAQAAAPARLAATRGAPCRGWKLLRPRCPAPADDRAQDADGIAAPILSPRWPLRRMPHAAQLVRRDRSEPVPRRQPGRAGRQEGAEHHPGPESRHRQLERGRHRHGADRRPDPDFDEVGGSMAEVVKNTAKLTRGGPPRDRGLPEIRAAGVRAGAEISRADRDRVSALDARRDPL